MRDEDAPIYSDRMTGRKFADAKSMVNVYLERFCERAHIEMHPLDVEERLEDLKDRDGVGYCNITRCCTKVCPEHITITDNAIIPLKERVVDRFYDPVKRLLRVFQK